MHLKEEENVYTFLLLETLKSKISRKQEDLMINY